MKYNVKYRKEVKHYDTEFGKAWINDGGYLQLTFGTNPCVHTLLLEEKLGRPIKDGYNCHHIDGNKLNNTPSNLIELSDSDHLKVHWHGLKCLDKYSNIWQDF
jgi:hypothetical protein